MMKHYKLFTPLAIFIVLTGILIWGLHHDPHTIPSPLLGKHIPSFTASNLNQPYKRLSEKVFKGHYTLLNVFASWCVACRAEHPILMDIAASHRITLIGLNYKDKPNVVLPWLHEYGNPYTTIISDTTGKIAINFGVYGTPESFIIDPNGIIVFKHIGPIGHADWQGQWLPRILRLEGKA